MTKLALVIFLISLTTAAFAQASQYSSETGVQQNIMVELYTSQGCSSCPPADDWLSEFKQDQRLWKTIFPVAFHVDYWNYIGWRDPFSSDTYSNRQRRYSMMGMVSSVYTPGFIVNGQEWRSWFRKRDINAILDKLNNKSGKLTLSLDDNKLMANFTPDTKHAGELVLNAAWLSMNIKTDVLAGENGGKTLHHDFVCRDWQRFSSNKRDGNFNWQQIVSEDTLKQADALVVWVSERDNPKPIQTTGFRLR